MVTAPANAVAVRRAPMMDLNCIAVVGLLIKSVRFVLISGGMCGFGMQEGVARENENISVATYTQRIKFKPQGG